MQPNSYYHIYNHANGNENLFRSKNNYQYFLKRYTDYIDPIANTYAYCFMPNHFHFLIQIKDEDILFEYFNGLKNNQISNRPAFENLTDKLSQQFSNFFNSYAKAYNKMYNRRGSLFNRPFKNKEVLSDHYFTELIHYIHFNPVHHGFTNTINNWPYSSFHVLVSNKTTTLKRIDVLEWFNGKAEFEKFHNQAIDLKFQIDDY